MYLSKSKKLKNNIIKKTNYKYYCLDVKMSNKE